MMGHRADLEKVWGRIVAKHPDTVAGKVRVVGRLDDGTYEFSIPDFMPRELGGRIQFWWPKAKA
jgi:hypothetical protein